jgi:hypothetical protein
VPLSAVLFLNFIFLNIFGGTNYERAILKADLIFYVRAVDPSVDTKYKMTPLTLIERQQFIEEEVKKLIHRRGIIMGGFLTL